MTGLTEREVDRIVPAPTWSSAADYERAIDRSGDGFLVMDTATILQDPFATVAMEWQFAVDADGAFAPPLEAIKLTVGDDTTYIETPQLAHVVSVVFQAAVNAGVTL